MGKNQESLTQSSKGATSFKPYLKNDNDITNQRMSTEPAITSNQNKPTTNYQPNLNPGFPAQNGYFQGMSSQNGKAIGN